MRTDRSCLFLEPHKVSLSLSIVVTSSCKCLFFQPLPRVFPLNGDIFSRQPSGPELYRLLSVPPQGDAAICFSRAFFSSGARGCRTGDAQREESSVNLLSLSKSKERKGKKKNINDLTFCISTSFPLVINLFPGFPSFSPGLK